MISRIKFGNCISACLATVSWSGQASAEEQRDLVFLCPFEVLQDAYANLTNPTDALSLLAIERHVLAICRESQTALLEIHENNRRLSELFAYDIDDKRIGVESRQADPEATEALSDEPDAGPVEAPVFELVAVTRQFGGERVAILKVDGVTGPVREADEVAPGYRVTADSDYGVILTTPDGTDVRIE